ncbi:MAG: carboxypeptidase regulatory-like domain-containing protein [Verrucomicrobiota bacterium]
MLLQSLPVFADDVITNFMSPIVSYQYAEDFSSEVLTNGGIQSPIVSFQYLQDFGSTALTNGGIISPIISYEYLENFSNMVLTNGGIMSPIVSYQYYEWPGSGILNLESSPVVSYYWQFGNSSGPVVLHGRVTDVNGVALADATVAVMIYLTPLAQANTDANGNYQMPSLDAGAYNLEAWDSAHQASFRSLTLNANTAEQDFQLKLMPSTPTSQQVNRSATVNYTVNDLMGSQLLIYNGSSFVPITANNLPSPNLMTIVMMHGWVWTAPDPSILNTPFDQWPANMAALLQSRGVTPATANIVAWDWRYAAMSSFPPSDPTLRTPDQGVGLGEALQQFLGASYSQPLHFIGHSLGTLVNAAAIDYLHGYRSGHQDYSPTPWANNLIHITLFDQAQMAEFGTKPVLDDGLDPTALDAWNAAFAPNNNAQQNWQSPLPQKFTWADNYESFVGGELPNVANIWLQKGALNALPSNPSLEAIVEFLDETHSYPIYWYDLSIMNPTDANNPLGFKRSYEYAPSAFPPSDTTTYHQAPANNDGLALEPVNTVERPLGLLPDVVLQTTVDTIQYTSGVTVQIANTVQNDFSSFFNYVGGIAASGGQAVVNLFDSAALNLTLSTIPSSSPNLQVRTGVHPLANSNDNSSLPPMVWLPIQIPANAAVMAFDFTVSGDPVNDSLVCGIGTNNLFSLQAKYIPTNAVSASRLIDVMAWAGATNELFFGFLGGTSTNATLEIENIRFYSFEQPALQAQANGGNLILSWPMSAQNFSLQTTTNLADSNSWTTLTNVPAIVNLQNTVTNPITGNQGFYRLIQSQ